MRIGFAHARPRRNQPWAVLNFEFRRREFILPGMKRALIPAGILLGLSLLRLPALGQDVAATNAAGQAAAVAEQQGVEEKFKQMAADIQTLRAANQALLDKVSALNEELQQIRAEQARLTANTLGRDDLKPLAQRIEEVDKKRQEDKDTISEEIKKSAARLEKLLTNAAEISPKPPIKPAPGAPPATEDGFSYTIKDGDRLLDIVNAYNAEFKSKGMKTITLKQAKDANPGVDWNNLHIGQKIVIPRPAE